MRKTPGNSPSNKKPVHPGVINHLHKSSIAIEPNNFKHVFRGHFNAAQVEAERKKFQIELTKISTMPKKLAETLAHDYDRVTEL